MNDQDPSSVSLVRTHPATVPGMVTVTIKGAMQ